VPESANANSSAHIIACSLVIFWVMLATGIHLSIYEDKEIIDMNPEIIIKVLFGDINNNTTEETTYITGTEDFALVVEEDSQRALALIHILIEYDESEATDQGECDKITITLILDDVKVEDRTTQNFEAVDCEDLEFDFYIHENFNSSGANDSGWNDDIRARWENTDLGVGQYVLRVSVEVEKGNPFSQDDGEEVKVTWTVRDYAVPVTIER
jgi:hypothetical protein